MSVLRIAPAVLSCRFQLRKSEFFESMTKSSRRTSAERFIETEMAWDWAVY
jgi:hypothetical protein